MGLGALLWPRNSLSSPRNLDGGTSAFGANESTHLGRGSNLNSNPLASEVSRLQSGLFSCILVDTIDIGLCTVGFVSNGLTPTTVIMLGSLGIFGVAGSVLAIRLLSAGGSKSSVGAF